VTNVILLKLCDGRL